MQLFSFYFIAVCNSIFNSQLVCNYKQRKIERNQKMFRSSFILLQVVSKIFKKQKKQRFDRFDL
jgi:hypothetical protein